MDDRSVAVHPCGELLSTFYCTEGPMENDAKTAGKSGSDRTAPVVRLQNFRRIIVRYEYYSEDGSTSYKKVSCI